YDAERRPVGQAVVERTSARMAKAISGEDRGEDEAQLREDSQLGIHYRESRWVVDARDDARGSAPQPTSASGPADRTEPLRAGDRAPNVSGLRHDFVAARSRLIELLRRPGHGVFFYADATTPPAEIERFARTADSLRERFGDAVFCEGIAGSGARPLGMERFAWRS